MNTHTQRDNQSLPEDLIAAVKKESERFLDYYLWLEEAMPSSFFEEVPKKSHLLITHSLMGFDLQDYFSIINLKSAAIVICLDSPDAELRILRHFEFYGIKNYQTYISKIPAPFPEVNASLRVATIEFMGAEEISENSLQIKVKEHLQRLAKEQNPDMSSEEFDHLLFQMGTPFLHALPLERQVLAINMLYRTETRDSCQCEIRYEEKWEEKKSGSMHMVLAWRNTPKHNFLYRLAKIINRHGLNIKRLNATYTDPNSNHSVLIMAISLHGINGRPVWKVADVQDFLREIVTFKYFDTTDEIDKNLVAPLIISGNMGNLLRAMVDFIHQALVHVDSNLYTIDNIEEALCRHPELTQQICEAFKYKFDPNHCNPDKYAELRQNFLNDVAQLDTGQESHDTRRKNVLLQGMNFIHHILKTNFYRINFTALSFRLDPNYLNEIPFERAKKFPELPYAIFYIKGMHFFSFHIRFKDLSRGGLRTVYPAQVEQMLADRNHVFSECYHLAWTQQKKNKDIPEGGSKAVIFLKPFTLINSESQILKKELEWSGLDYQQIEDKISEFLKEQKIEYMYQSQRAFIENLLIIINCDENGRIRARSIIDYWKKPEYIYLGPDENMHDFMIEWIANISKKYNYIPGRAFISSKPYDGINHKEYGVTSLGVNVYMHHVLEYLGINPEKDVFTVKMSGGPDGDVAGNQLLNLARFYPKTAKVIALTDGTGTIRDNNGLNLEIIKDLFYKGSGIASYPAEQLSEGGFLLDKNKKRYPSAYIQETLCLRKTNGKIQEDWLSGSDTNQILRHNLHQAQTDVFIPAGGRPRTLNEHNISEFLNASGAPTSKAIIEGANLYLTPFARKYLEDKGVLIIKDSSANKGGVICSSFEVLCGLAISQTDFLENKAVLVGEILDHVKQCAANEAELLLRMYKQTGENLTVISDKISDRINQYTYQLLDYLNSLSLPKDLNDPLIISFLNYCLPTLRKKFLNELLNNIPESHKKAIIACHLAAQIVYTKGLSWSPSIIDILPVIISGAQLSG